VDNVQNLERILPLDVIVIAAVMPLRGHIAAAAASGPFLT
jgi:hypothetical protein